ncbi:MAG: threonylcarbamoyl-AMP synthase [Caldisericia bacterium]|nr:threonylcarbamoyl-AMP synthase [Caldisericia bacterium]
MLKVILILLSYLYGSIPFGFIFVKKKKGIDIRKVGSGNIGATNVLRIAGLSIAIISGIFDLSKGLLPILIGRYIFHFDIYTIFLMGFSGVIGHDFSIFLGFKGGKGVAATFGVVIGLIPAVAFIELLIFISVLALTKFVSLSSIISFLFAPFVLLIFKNYDLAFLSIFLSLLGIYRHKDNINRLRYGIESKFGEKETLKETMIFNPSKENLEKIKKILENGGIGIIPTDTIYGLCANGLDKNLIKKIYKIKKRDFNKPLVLFVKNKSEIEKYAYVDDLAIKIIDRYMPGEITIVLKKKEGCPEVSLKKFDTIAFRIPNNKFVIDILNLIDFPLATTSANISKEETPQDLEGLKDIFYGVVDFIVDGGELGKTPSTVVQVIDGKVDILREGKIKKEDIFKTIS